MSLWHPLAGTMKKKAGGTAHVALQVLKQVYSSLGRKGTWLAVGGGGGGVGPWPAPVDPPPQPPHIRKVFLRQKMKFIKGAGNLRPTQNFFWPLTHPLFLLKQWPRHQHCFWGQGEGLGTNFRRKATVRFNSASVGQDPSNLLFTLHN